MHQFHIHLARTDCARNVARFYELSLDRTLFGDLVVIRRWGRIGTLGRSRQEPVQSEIHGLRRLLRALRIKRRRGYAPVGVAQRTSALWQTQSDG